MPSFDLTLAFGAWKPAHFGGGSLAKIGAPRLVEIGVPDRGASIMLSEHERIAAPDFGAYKYTRGLVAVVGGAMPGAGLLASRAAALAAGFAAVGGAGGYYVVSQPDAADGADA